MTVDAPAPAFRRRSLWPAALIAAATVLVYANTLGAPFVFDDVIAIPQNPTLRHWWRLDQVLFPPGGGVTVSGRPVLNLSLALNYALSGTAPWSYHVLNALIHTAAGLLVYGVIRRTLEYRAAAAPRDGVRSPAPAPAIPALLIALLWALHPLQTQAVTYTIQRAESLMGLFFLLTLYAFIRSAAVPLPDGASAGNSPESRAATGRWQAVSVIACLLGMGAKEVMVTAPVLVLLFDRTFVAGTFRAAWRQRRGYYVALAATWLLLAALVVSTGNRGGTAGFGTGVAPLAYPLTQFHAVARYLALGVWPHPLIFEYGTFWVSQAADVVPYAMLVLPLLAATAFALRRWPALGFCGAWFFLILAPTSLTPGTLQMIVEHRMYLPLAAVLTVVVLGLQRIAGRMTTALALVAALACALLTVHRNLDYASHLALWRDTVAKRPDNPRARAGLAEALEESGRADEAVAQRTIAAQRTPQDSRAHLNLANALLAAGRNAEAAREYETTLGIDPSDAKAHNNLAIALRALGRADAAIAHNAAAVRLAPNEAGYRINFGTALMNLRRDEDAAAEFASAVRLRPDDADAHYNLGAALMRLKRVEDAVPHFATAARLVPTDAQFRSTLGRSEAEWADRLLDADRLREATVHYEAAAKNLSDDAVVHHNLGIAYARQERWPDAQREFETALRLKPDYVEAREHLAQLRDVLK